MQSRKLNWPLQGSFLSTSFRSKRKTTTRNKTRVIKIVKTVFYDIACLTVNEFVGLKCCNSNHIYTPFVRQDVLPSLFFITNSRWEHNTWEFSISATYRDRKLRFFPPPFVPVPKICALHSTRRRRRLFSLPMLCRSERHLFCGHHENVWATWYSLPFKEVSNSPAHAWIFPPSCLIALLTYVPSSHQSPWARICARKLSLVEDNTSSSFTYFSVVLMVSQYITIVT